MAAAAVLPVELWAPIIAHADSKADLANLTRVSKTFQHEAERMLYRSVIIHPNDSTLPVAVTSSRRRASLIQECTLYLPRTSSGHSSGGCNSMRNLKPSPATQSLVALLMRMRNLTSLTIRGPLPASLTATAAKSLEFPFRLQTLCTTEAFSKPLLAFLRLQPSITRFTILHPSPLDAPSCSPASLSAVLPNTNALAAVTPDAALALLPYRPVTHLHILTLNNAAPSDVLPPIAESSGPLRALMCARGLELAPSDLGLIALHLPNLAFLGDVSITEDVTAYLPALESLKNLQTLLVNRESKGFRTRFSEGVVVRTLGSVNASLDRVVFTHRGAANYIWERKIGGSGNEWCVKRVQNPVEIAADLWRAT